MDFYIQDFGAVGDGKSLCTDAIQAAIDKAAGQGGRVILENGTFRTGSLELRSNVTFHIAADAVLLGSEDPADYRDFKELSHIDWELAPRKSNSCLLLIHECENVAITGFGTIDCNGQHFVVPAPEDKACNYKRIDGFTPPRVVLCTGSRNIVLQDISMINQPAGWSYWIHDCDGVTITGLTIRCSVEYPNNDGVHINCSRNVTVSDCDIYCGDDCIVLRANSVTLKENKPCQNVTVTDCRLTSYSAGVRVAWVNDGVIRDCSLSRLTMTDCSVGVSLYIPPLVRSERNTDVGREYTLVENLCFRDITMEAAGYPVFIRIGDRPEVTVDAVGNIFFENMSVRSPQLPLIEGRPGCPVRDITFRDCSFIQTDGSECAKRPCTGWLMTPGHHYDPLPMTLHHTENIQFIDTSFSTEV